MHIKNQAIENRRIYVRIMFRLKKMFRDVYDYCKALWDRFKQLINYDNNISRCVRGALFRYKDFEKSLKIMITMIAIAHKALLIDCAAETFASAKK